MKREKIEVSLGDITLQAAQAPSDARYPLFQHLYDVHKWDISAAFNLCNSQLGKDSALTKCCPLKGCGKPLGSVITLTDA